MSFAEAHAEVAEELTSNVRFISGAFVGSGAFFISEFSNAIIKMMRRGIASTLLEVIPQVAKKTGVMRSSIEQMLIFQSINLDTRQGFKILFDRNVVIDPPYLRLHDIEWELNPKFAGGYKAPTTLGTKPFSEQEIFDILYVELVKHLISEFIAKGFNFTINRLS